MVVLVVIMMLITIIDEVYIVTSSTLPFLSLGTLHRRKA